MCEEIIGRMNLTAPVFGNTTVQVNHEDGSAMTFRYALCWRYGDWLLVATEHNGYHYFHTGDLAHWSFSEAREIKHVDADGHTFKAEPCFHCFKQVHPRDLTLAPIPTEEIDLCPDCTKQFAAGLLTVDELLGNDEEE